MRHEFIPSPLTRESLRRPPPLEGAPAAGASGMPGSRVTPPENASRIERLLHDLDSEDWTVCAEAQTQLVSMGTDPVDTLCEALRTASWNVRWRSAWVLGRIGDIAAVPPLCEALKDKYGYAWEANLQSFTRVDRTDGRALVPTATREQRVLLRMEAAEALGRIGEPEAIPALCGALWDGFDQVRERASLALAQIGEPALEAILEVVEGSGTEPRVWAVRALSRIEEPRVIPVLIELLEDSYRGVRIASAEGLMQLAPRHATLELRGAVPVLRQLVSPWSLAAGDRAVFQAALKVIEESTVALRDLPLPSVAGSPSTEALPLPARPHATGSSQLPLPSTAGVRTGAGPDPGPGLIRRIGIWLRERLR